MENNKALQRAMSMQQAKWSNPKAVAGWGVDLISFLHDAITEHTADESLGSRKENAVCATSARLPYGMFQTHYCLMTAHRLGHQCGLNWNWSFTDFWITSRHGLRGAWNSSSHHCWFFAHKSYSKLKSINKRYFENIHKELKLCRAFTYAVHTQHSARSIIKLFCDLVLTVHATDTYFKLWIRGPVSSVTLVAGVNPQLSAVVPSAARCSPHHLHQDKPKSRKAIRRPGLPAPIYPICQSFLTGRVRCWPQTPLMYSYFHLMLSLHL